MERKMIKKVTIELSEPGMRMEFFPGGHHPEISIVHDQGKLRTIGVIHKAADLRRLKEALKDVAN
jgi:hypothetical protein